MTRRIPGSRHPLVSLALLPLLVAACAQAVGHVPDEPPYITGVVTDVGTSPSAGGRGAVLVEAYPDSSGGDKSRVNIAEGTRVLRAGGQVAGADALHAGQRVRVWVDGPVLESYPTQSTGRVIVIDAESP